MTAPPLAAADPAPADPGRARERPRARVAPTDTPALLGHWLETVGAWLLGLLWLLPLAYAVWTAFHPSEFSTRFVPSSASRFASALACASKAGFVAK